MEWGSEMSCAKKITGRRKESRVFDTTHMVINSHLVAVVIQEKCPESDYFEEL
jgi:hypothetical protein